jgi:hypothetical protein
MPRFPLPVAALVTALLAASAGAIPPNLQVDNPAEPAAGVQTLRLEPVWRLGGEDEDVFFGVIDAAAVDRDGNVLLADIQLMQINVVSPDGEIIGVLGRQGEGPGEVTRLGGVLPLPDGNVGMVQLMPGRVVKVDGEGLPAGEIVPRWKEDGGRLMLADLKVAGDRLVAAGRRMTRRDETFTMDLWIAELAADGEVGRTFYGDQRQRDFRGGAVSELDGDWAGQGRWTATADGRVVVAPARDEYRLEMYGTDGLERTVTRAFTTRRRTEAEKDAVRERFSRFRGGRGGRGGGGGGRPADLQVEVMDTEPAIAELHAMPGGEVWVRTSRSDQEQAEGVMLTYDVIDTGGNFARQVSVACEGLAARDRLIPLGDDLFILVLRHADAVAAMRGAAVDDDADLLEDGEPLEVIGLRVVR